MDIVLRYLTVATLIIVHIQIVLSVVLALLLNFKRKQNSRAQRTATIAIAPVAKCKSYPKKWKILYGLLDIFQREKIDNEFSRRFAIR